jgi:hypothetical protein
LAQDCKKYHNVLKFATCFPELPDKFRSWKPQTLFSALHAYMQPTPVTAERTATNLCMKPDLIRVLYQHLRGLEAGEGKKEACLGIVFWGQPRAASLIPEVVL